MSLQPAAVRQFWTRFRAASLRLREVAQNGDLDTVFAQVKAMLREAGLPWVFEVTTDDDGDAVLAITPEGDSEAASDIDELLRSKPSVVGWKIYGRRQRKPLEDAYVFVDHIYGVDLRGAGFKLDPDGAGYRVTMFTENLNDRDENEALDALATLLDHAVGEETVMRKVVDMQVESDLSSGETLSLRAVRDRLAQ